MLFEVGLICNTAFDNHIFNTVINSKASTYDSQLEKGSVLFMYRKTIRQSAVCLSSFQGFFGFFWYLFDQWISKNNYWTRILKNNFIKITHPKRAMSSQWTTLEIEKCILTEDFHDLSMTSFYEFDFFNPENHYFKTLTFQAFCDHVKPNVCAWPTEYIH